MVLKSDCTNGFSASAAVVKTFLSTLPLASSLKKSHTHGHQWHPSGKNIWFPSQFVFACEDSFIIANVVGCWWICMLDLVYYWSTCLVRYFEGEVVTRCSGDFGQDCLIEQCQIFFQSMPTTHPHRPRPKRDRLKQQCHLYCLSTVPWALRAQQLWGHKAGRKWYVFAVENLERNVRGGTFSETSYSIWCFDGKKPQTSKVQKPETTKTHKHLSFGLWKLKHFLGFVVFVFPFLIFLIEKLEILETN